MRSRLRSSTSWSSRSPTQRLRIGDPHYAQKDCCIDGRRPGCCWQRQRWRWQARLVPPPSKGSLFFNGAVVRTVVVPAAIPHGGTDTFYEVQGGEPGQLGITS